MPNFNYLYENIDNKMRNLRFYENDSDFKANEIAAGGDGNSVMTSIPGVASVWEENKAYYNPHDVTKLMHTVTVNYRGSNGLILAPSETIEVPYYSGVTQEVVLTPKNIDGYVPKDGKKTIIVPDVNAITFMYSPGLDLSQPLTFKILCGGTIYWASNTSTVSYHRTIEYKKNSGDWTSITSNTGASAPGISVNSGDVVEFRGNNVYYSVGGYHNYFSCTTGILFEAEGNIMSLVDSTDFSSATTLGSQAFGYLFDGCFGLISAEKLILPATTLAYNCYHDMFQGCISLTVAPELPATTLASQCYMAMFRGCTSLTTAPELPAITLASQCYYSMFSGCTSLTTAPELPATTLSGGCYSSMFAGCTSLTTAPELPVMTLVGSCYYNMFRDCTSLTFAPELPATTLVDGCYQYMFKGCTSLTTAPELPATTVAAACYNYMFSGCTALTIVPSVLPATIVWANCYREMFAGCISLATAPELPATTLGNYCYEDMFYGCTSLTTAPSILPATTLTSSCYEEMFRGCTSLTTAPELPATTLAKQCYLKMFYNCTSLNYIKCLATNISASYCTTNWISGVASSGTFVKNPNMSSWTTGYNGIPANWTVQNA